MVEKQKIIEYRERLDKTLASPDLTNEESLKALVKNQLLRSHDDGIGISGCNKILINKRTAEVSSFLEMLRSTSVNHNDAPKSREWKLKQDDEEFRVMYREGPEGTPYHTLLVEGYVDGSLDVCLCISWQSELYKKWWPQSSIPTFKVLSSNCLQKLRTGEQISLVRVKVSWPLSTREAVIHYFLFEYFQDDLIIVLLNSISDLESISRDTHGFTSEAIPEAKDVVRIDLVGGFALQKVTPERSYFRTIANMDIKLDFVPPSLINFISRQLIANGFRLYQKAITSMFKSDDDFGKALGDPLYARIREALYCKNKQDNTLEEKELNSNEFNLPVERLGKEQDDSKDTDQEDCEMLHISEPGEKTMQVKEREAFREIEEEESLESIHIGKDDKDKDNLSTINIEARFHTNGKRNIVISPDVEKALETLDKVILMAREYGFNPQTKSSPGFTGEEAPNVEKGIIKDSNDLEVEKLCSNGEVGDQVPKKEIAGSALEEQPPRNSSSTNSFRRIGSNSFLREVNHNKIAPASPEQKLSFPSETNQVSSYSINTGTIEVQQNLDQTTQDYKQTIKEVNSIHEKENSLEEGKNITRPRKHRFCCFVGGLI